MRCFASLLAARTVFVRLLVLALLFAAPASALVAAAHGTGTATPDAHAAAAAHDADHGHSHAIDDDFEPTPAHTHDHNPTDHFHEAAGPAALSARHLRPAGGPVDPGADVRPKSGPPLALERPPRG